MTFTVTELVARPRVATSAVTSTARPSSSSESDAEATIPGRQDQAVEHDKGHEDEVDLAELKRFEDGLQADGADGQEPPKPTIDPQLSDRDGADDGEGSKG